MDRILLAEVASFAENGKKCFMTNAKLAEALSISEDRTRKIIYRLIESGHLNRGVVANGQGGCKRTLGWAQTDRGVGANSQGGGRKRTPTKQLTKHITKTLQKKGENFSVVLPWHTEAFTAAWSEWLEYKKSDHRFTYKSPKSEQRALIQLQNEYSNETDAIEAIHRSIANGYKGLVFKQRPGSRTNASRASNLKTDVNREKLAEFARTGRIEPDGGPVL